MTINNEQIPAEIVEREFQRLQNMQAQQPSPVNLSEEELRKMAADNVLSQVLLRQEAEKRFTGIPEEEQEKHYRKQLKKAGGKEAFLKRYRLPEEALPAVRREMITEMKMQKLFTEEFNALPPLDANDAEREYNADPHRYDHPEQVHVSHIVRHTYGEADPAAALKAITAAQQDLKNGKSFDDVVKKYSDCDGQGGDLGTFPRGKMVEKFENVVFRMKPGELSEIFQTEFGYHIALLHEKIPAVSRPFTEVRDDILRYLREKQRNDCIGALLGNLKESATIEA